MWVKCNFWSEAAAAHNRTSMAGQERMSLILLVFVFLPSLAKSTFHVHVSRKGIPDVFFITQNVKQTYDEERVILVAGFSSVL